MRRKKIFENFSLKSFKINPTTIYKSKLEWINFNFLKHTENSKIKNIIKIRIHSKMLV